ncbi:MAG: flagellar basal body L-ring protein FlgH [Gammaproteobacteria bacterium]|nr:flagellar basal body L-ring protein FlgH [Gammaproteobacteria bacterium]
MNAIIRTTVVLSAVATLAGCNSAPVRNTDYAPPPPPAQVQQPAAPLTGSLYTPGARHMVLFTDTRATHVGDLITINLVEKTDATKSSSQTTARSASASVTNPTIFGRAFKFGSNPNDTLESSLSASTSTDGSGDAAKSNTLEGTITVSVVDVYPNGNLLVRGEKLVGINQGHEYIRIEGIVRPDDIAADNTVDSTRLGNVMIDYGGEGPVADASKVGWLARFFISAVFPF